MNLFSFLWFPNYITFLTRENCPRTCPVAFSLGHKLQTDLAMLSWDSYLLQPIPCKVMPHNSNMHTHYSGDFDRIWEDCCVHLTLLNLDFCNSLSNDMSTLPLLSANPPATLLLNYYFLKTQILSLGYYIKPYRFSLKPIIYPINNHHSKIYTTDLSFSE